MKKTKIVNLYSGPGTGKSTMCAALFAEFKFSGVDCEMATEYAKDLVWQKSFKTLECQPYVFGKQLHRLARLNGQVDYVITDSPLLLSLVYDKDKSQEFINYALKEYNKFDNINIFLIREKKYNPNGRMQTESEAKLKDKEIRTLLDTLKIHYTEAVSNKSSVYLISDMILHGSNTLSVINQLKAMPGLETSIDPNVTAQDLQDAILKHCRFSANQLKELGVDLDSRGYGGYQFEAVKELKREDIVDGGTGMGY